MKTLQETYKPMRWTSEIDVNSKMVGAPTLNDASISHSDGLFAIQKPREDLAFDQNVENAAHGAAKTVAGISNSQVATGAFVLAGAAVIATAAWYIYKRFFSAAAKACSTKSGAEKTKCINQFKRKAVMATIGKLNGSKSKCAAGKAGEKCRINVDHAILKWRRKMASIKA